MHRQWANKERLRYPLAELATSLFSEDKKGRTAIFEFLDVDDDLRDLIKAQASTRAYREQVEKLGTRSLREAGIGRVIEGVTTLEEVLRVCHE